ncbi:MAG TPA: undecaprenyl-phosphate glucose phosphotransferase, partial [Rhizobacter sp.]|nr:undecaprenyl-phosphate glucose phosphotransferase [Rhizobacter sp.]
MNAEARHRLFPAAPPSIHAFVAAVLEPVVTLASFLIVAMWHGEPIERPALILCMLVIVLTFPGVDRFKENHVTAAISIVRDWIAVAAILLLFGYATESFEFFPTRVLIWWAVLTPAFQWVAVVGGRKWLHSVTGRPEFRRRSIIIGAGDNGMRVAAALAQQADCSHELVGFFEDRSAERVHAEALGKVIGRVDDVAEHVKQNNIHHVYITLPLTAQPRIVELLSQLQDTTSSVHYAPDVFGINIIQGQLQDINGVPLVSLLETPITGTNHLLKRGTDMVLSSTILALVFPLLLLLALGVKLSSPGPVIFKQRRTGLDGKEILVFKFRSMTTQDNGGVVQQATRNDPRITPFGAFIRKTSLDELPQLFNVLLGSMSLVGPRPHAVAHNEQYRKIVQAYMLRHKVRPGITGWAQVNGYRGETDTVDKMAARVH